MRNVPCPMARGALLALWISAQTKLKRPVRCVVCAEQINRSPFAGSVYWMSILIVVQVCCGSSWEKTAEAIVVSIKVYRTPPWARPREGQQSSGAGSRWESALPSPASSYRIPRVSYRGLSLIFCRSSCDSFIELPTWSISIFPDSATPYPHNHTNPSRSSPRILL